jgi:hypothetical protein
MASAMRSGGLCRNDVFLFRPAGSDRQQLKDFEQ